MKKLFALTTLLCAIAASTYAADPKWDTNASRAAKTAEQRALVDQAVSPSTPRDAKEIQTALKAYGFATALMIAYGRFPKTPDGTVLSVVVTADGNLKDCHLKSPTEGVSEEFVTRVCDHLRTVYFGRKNAPESIRFPLGLARPSLQ